MIQVIDKSATCLGYRSQPQILLGYRRKSMVRHQADLVSPERQTHACKLWLEMHGSDYTIEWFEDVEGHKSGRHEEGRPGWQELLKQLERPEVAGVIVDSIDRAYRNVHEFLQFLNLLERLNKTLVSIKQSLDTSSPMGRAIVTILMVIYQLESDQTSERMAANVKYKPEVLGRHWGPTPFGCDRNAEGHLIPTVKQYLYNPLTGEACVESDVLKDGWELRRFYDGLVEIYQTYSQGHYSYEATAEMVNTAGWRYYADSQADPCLFTADAIRRIVSFWQLYRSDLPLGNITNTRNPTVLPGGHEPILPVELCNQVGAVKAQRGLGSGSPSPGQPQHVYLLGNVLFCAVCGKPLKGQFQDGRRIYRHYGGKKGCREKWTLADEIEADVLDMLTSLNDSVLLEAVEAEAKRLAREVFAQDDGSRSLLVELDRHQNRLTQLEYKYLDGDFEQARYQMLKAEITQAISELEDKLYAATQTVNFSPILERITATLSRLVSASFETKKTLINSVIQRLDVGGGEIIHLTPSPWARPFF